MTVVMKNSFFDLFKYQKLKCCFLYPILSFYILLLIFGGYTLIFHDVYSFSRQWNAYILLIIIYLILADNKPKIPIFGFKKVITQKWHLFAS